MTRPLAGQSTAGRSNSCDPLAERTHARCCVAAREEPRIRVGAAGSCRHGFEIESRAAARWCSVGSGRIRTSSPFNLHMCTWSDQDRHGPERASRRSVGPYGRHLRMSRVLHGRLTTPATSEAETAAPRAS